MGQSPNSAGLWGGRRGCTRGRGLAAGALTGVIALLLAAPASQARVPLRQNPLGKQLGVILSLPSPGAGLSPAAPGAPLLPGAASPGTGASTGGGGNGQLTYGGGPVMGTPAQVGENTTRVIYWAPVGYSFPAGYSNAIEQMLTDVSIDSGRSTNVYATDTQYTQQKVSVAGQSYAAPIAYKAHHDAPIVDTNLYPANSGCAGPIGVNSKPCLSDAQIQAELSALVTQNQLPVDLAHLYIIALPQNVSVCTGQPASQCSNTVWCAYHSYFADTTNSTPRPPLYSVVTWPEQGTATTCYGGSTGLDTPTLAAVNFVSHEHNEAITDPLGTGWYDSVGYENGDKCAYTYGTQAGGANQHIGSNDYLLQTEWSNENKACAQAEELPVPAVSRGPAGDVATGQGIAFDGSSSADSDGTMRTYSWDFGDGSSATGATPAAHAYAHAGSYTATLTVTDSGGWQATATSPVTVVDRPPVASFGFTPTTPPTGQSVLFDAGASADPDGTVSSYSWDFGDGSNATGASPSHSFARAGTYTVSLTVTDNSSNTATVTHTIVVADRPPLARFGFAPSSPLSGQRVAFDGGSSSDIDGSLSSYAWSFGDGSGASGAQTGHAYAQPGSYAVSLTVTDNSGNTDTLTQAVTIDSAAPLLSPAVAPASPPAGPASSGPAASAPLASAPARALILAPRLPAMISIGRFARYGLSLPVRCLSACRLVTVLQARAPHGTSAQRRGIVIGRGAGSLGHAGRVLVRIRSTASVRAFVRQAHVSLLLTVTARDPSGAAGMVRRAVAARG